MFDEPFRGSRAVAAGLVTPDQLRGPRFRRLFRDVYVTADRPVDLELRSRGGYLAISGRGALAGWSAAELLGASCGPRDAPVELITSTHRRSRSGLVLQYRRPATDELTMIDGIRLTTPLRTAFDLARRAPVDEAVVAVDALSRVGGFPPAAVCELGKRYLGARGTGQLGAVVAAANPLSGSPMETRIRLAVVAGGLPVPQLQYPIGPFFVDLAYPAIRLAIEYDGRDHLTQERARRDLERQAFLTAAGWDPVLRFRAAEVFRAGAVAARVRREITRYAHRHDYTMDEVLSLIGFGV